jgi:hypothetical protein
MQVQRDGPADGGQLDRVQTYWLLANWKKHTPSDF